MVRAKPEVAGKTAKSKEHPAVTRIKKLEKRVAKLEKEKEEDRRHAKLWKANYLKEQRDFEERAWRLIAKRRNDLEAKVPSTLEKRVSKLEKGRGKEEVQWHTRLQSILPKSFELQIRRYAPAQGSATRHLWASDQVVRPCTGCSYEASDFSCVAGDEPICGCHFVVRGTLTCEL